MHWPGRIYPRRMPSFIRIRGQIREGYKGKPLVCIATPDGVGKYGSGGIDAGWVAYGRSEEH